jgi:acyl carrier protein
LDYKNKDNIIIRHVVTQMTNNQLQKEINQLIELSLGRRPVETDTLLIEGYGAESADIANITVALEQKYDILIPESALPKLRTPRDFYNFVTNTRNNS